jgi:hypothetical protein
LKKNQLIQAAVVWLVTSIVIYLAPQVWSGGVVVGNDRMSAFAASAVAGLALTVATLVAMPLLDMAKMKSMAVQGVAYLVVDVAVIWLLGRMATNTGLGLSGWMAAVVLGVIVWVVQYVVYSKVMPDKK